MWSDHDDVVRPRRCGPTDRAQLSFSLCRISHEVLEQFTHLQSVRGLVTTVEAWRALHAAPGLTHLECGNMEREHFDLLPPSLAVLRAHVKIERWSSSEWSRVLTLPLLTELHVPRGYVDDTTFALTTRLTQLAITVKEENAPQGTPPRPRQPLTFARLRSLDCNLYPLRLHRYPVLRALSVKEDWGTLQMTQERCDNVIELLRDIPTLTELRLPRSICDKSLQKLCAADDHPFRTLYSLTVGTSAEAADLRCLAACSLLETLTVYCDHIPAHLPAIPTLQHFHMITSNRDSTWIAALPALYPNLKRYWVPALAQIRHLP